MRRWLPRIAVLAVLAGAATFVWIEKPWQSTGGGVKFATVGVGKGSITAQVTANGTLSARGTVLVGAQVSGRLIELNADFNDQVKKGQVIAKLDESVLKAQIDQAQAAYDLAVANQHKAAVAVTDTERQLKRQKVLQEQALVAGAVVETAETAWETARASLVAARAQVSQAAANLKQARTSLSYATIYSPVDGVVLSRAVELGQTVAASLQAPTLFTIAEDLARMQIDTAVAEADVGKLADGMKASFTVDAFPGRLFDGVVRQVRNAPTTVSGVVTYDAVIDVENTDKKLRPGMTANVTFTIAETRPDTIRIPNSALRFKPTQDQRQALFAQFGGGMRGSGSGMRGSGERFGRGGEGSGRRPEGAGGPGGPGGQGGPRREGSDRRVLWKLVDGRPRVVPVKLGLTDGTVTELLEGDIKPDDQLITEVTGLPPPPRRVGAF